MQTSKIERTSGTKRAPLFMALALVLAAGSFVAVLLIQSPFPLRPLSILVRYGFLSVIPLMAVLFLGIYNLPGRLGRALHLIFIFFIFSLVLKGLWESGTTEPSIVNGLLPWQDAAKYYVDAQRLNAGFLYGEKTAMRPFFTGLLALFLWLGGHSLQFSTALLVLFTALSFYFMLEESRRIFSPLVCVSLFLLLFLYYRGLAGSTLTENLGLAFGALGAGLLIQASRTKKLAWASAGIFMVSMALNTRPGPFFVLPFLVFWAAFYLRTDANRFWKAFFLTAGAGLLPFVFNSIMMRILSDTITIPFANFAYAIYGLVSDGNRYVQIFIDHPEVAQIQGNAHYLEIFRLTWSTFLSKPQNLFIGMFKNYCLFFSNSWYSMYGYVLSDHMLLTTIVRYALYVLSLLGVICGLRRTDKPVNKLVLAGFLGVLLSVPFVPPGDAHKVRLYAAALPLMILLPALGLQWCLDWTQWSWLYQPKDGKLPDRSSFRYSLFLVGLTLISPLIIALLSDAKAYQSSVCPQGQEAVIMRYDQGAFLRILREEEFFLDRMPDFHYGQYALSVHGLATQPEIAFFETIEPPAVISLGIDLNTGGELWFAANPDSMPAEDGVYGFCGRYEDKPYTFFYADQLVELSSVK